MTHAASQSGNSEIVSICKHCILHTLLRACLLLCKLVYVNSNAL